MTNPLQIANKSKLVAERARIVFADIKQQYEQGQIKTEGELKYRVYLALEDFFLQFGKPSMRVRAASGAPVSEDYNQTMKEVLTDLSVVFAECKYMAEALAESFSKIEIERQQLTGQMNKIQDTMKEIELKMQQKRNEVIFRDSFANANNFDDDMVDGNIATLNASEGVLSLTKIEAEEYRDNIRVTILEGNGLPGNTHQVRAISGTYKFFGEDNLHMNLRDILDGNSDTWFEYEAFEITDAVKAATGGHGFQYREGHSWVSNDIGALRLQVEIEMPVARTVNWLSISPFIPADKGAAPAVVRSVIIQDGKGSANEVSSTYDILREDQVFIFARQKCKKIIIKLECGTGYETLVGHFFFKELEDTINYMSKDKEQAGRRIDGPKPSIEELGYKYDPTTRGVNQPSQSTEDTSGAEEGKKERLFGLPSVKGQVQAGLEAVTAKRYVIGLRDMSISSYRFATSAHYISTPFVSSEPIRSASLDVTASVPKEFGEGDWLSYFISIDDGKTWYEIYPRGTSKSGAKISYSINSNVPIEGRFDNVGYLDTLEPVKMIRLKITLKRPTDIKDSDYYTPIVKEYKLRCTTANEVR